VSNTTSTDTAVRPFRVDIPQDELDDLKRRILATRWPTKETVNDASQGVQLSTMQALAEYWATQHDWRKVEARLNSYPQFLTEIDGLDIHFLHIRSKHDAALPMVVTHGWPGSVIEQLKIIEPLTDPESFGGTAADAFHLVIPSLPGHGFSGTPTVTGWDPIRIASAWAELMRRLGYDHYVAQGGDWGNAVTEQLALQKPDGLVAIHTNMPAAEPDAISAIVPGGPEPAGLSADEKQAWDQLVNFWLHGLGYAQEMAGRPQTLYALDDSPIGLASWMLDHDPASEAMIARVFAGGTEGLSKDDVLDNVDLYWFTRTAVSSARLYWESKLTFFGPKGVTLPTAISAFPEEIYTAPESWVREAYPNLIHYNRLAKGGHFAAWEQPDEFVSEMRESFRSVR
jgi:pimeloyl-ACP methyl ester carboxylesterase